jgi:hypothetical protein
VEHQQQYVGIDLHRRRSVIVRVTGEGEVLEVVRIVNDPVALSLELAKAGPDPEVALEATYGWYWAADLLEADGAGLYLVHPLGLYWDARRVKNDERDATELAHRLRRGDLPESWIASPEVRELRELIRYRAKLAALRTSAKAQIHAVMAKLGILPPMSEMFGPTGQGLLDEMPFEGAYATRVASLRGLLERYEAELVLVEHQLHGRLADHKGYSAIQALNGVGRITAAIMVAGGLRGHRERPGGVSKDSPRFALTVARPPDGPDGGQASFGRSRPTFCAPCAASPPRETVVKGTWAVARHARIPGWRSVRSLPEGGRYDRYRSQQEDRRRVHPGAVQRG